ncbi:hypothetical protein C8Q78DRAFT_1076127 [Trametes maxima]|nr:hypothetical protein C8Q78DRAFT_1076127 [Trametes maxima]
MSLDVILLTSAAVFSGLRVYALCSLRWWIFAVVTLLGMTCPAIIAYTVTEMRDNVVDFSPYARACYYTAKISNVRFESCEYPHAIKPLPWIIGARVSSLVADSLVVTVTAVRTLRVSSPFKGSFSSILFCDGAMYFIVLLSANIAGLGLIRHFNFIEPMGMWISILTSIMTSRFILDLLGANDALRGTLPTPGTSVVFCSPQQDKSVYETFIPGMSDEEAFDDGWEPSESCDTNPELEGQSSTVYSQYSDWIDVSDRELELPVY